MTPTPEQIREALRVLCVLYDEKIMPDTFSFIGGPNVHWNGKTGDFRDLVGTIQGIPDKSRRHR